jgi:ATP-dependent Clp endopeptidase proteolytic subunit ClpP
MDETDDGEDFARESTAERIIRLTGEISEETSESFILNLHRVAKIPGEIIVIVSSEGGDIEEGLRIIDALQIAKNNGCPVHTVVSGKAYSMAAYIVCTGDTRTIYPHSRLMFHASRFEGADDGRTLTAVELQKMHDELSMCDDVFRELMANVGLDQATIERMLASDTYVNAEEAISLGIINSIETAII